MKYHGIIVDASLKEKSLLEELKIIGQKRTKDGEWVLYKIEIDPEDINQTIESLQENLLDGFYLHLYRQNELIVVFPERVFRINTEKPTWIEAIEYGKSLGIPEEQLDFFPCRTEDESY